MRADTFVRLQAKLEAYALNFMEVVIGEMGLLSYYDVSPTCKCAGPSFEDCDGKRCPSYIMQTEDNECPTLCEPNQVLPLDGSEYV